MSPHQVCAIVETNEEIVEKIVCALGGVWVRLETEWRENHLNAQQQPKQRSIFTGKTRTSKTIGNTTNNSNNK